MKYFKKPLFSKRIKEMKLQNITASEVTNDLDSKSTSNSAVRMSGYGGGGYSASLLENNQGSKQK